MVGSSQEGVGSVREIEAVKLVTITRNRIYECLPAHACTFLLLYTIGIRIKYANRFRTALRYHGLNRPACSGHDVNVPSQLISTSRLFLGNIASIRCDVVDTWRVFVG